MFASIILIKVRISSAQKMWEPCSGYKNNNEKYLFIIILHFLLSRTVELCLFSSNSWNCYFLQQPQRSVFTMNRERCGRRLFSVRPFFGTNHWSLKFPQIIKHKIIKINYISSTIINAGAVVLSIKHVIVSYIVPLGRVKNAYKEVQQFTCSLQ